MIAPVSTLKILRLGEPDSPVRTAYTLKKIENVKKDENVFYFILYNFWICNGTIEFET